MLEEVSRDGTVLAGQKKTRSRGGKTVKSADPGTDTIRGPIHTRSSTKHQSLKSSLKTSATTLFANPKSSETANPPSSTVSGQTEDKELDTEGGETIETLAASAIKMVKNAREERLQRGLEASQKELAPTRTDLDNEKLYKEVLLETNELMDTRKRAETALAELKEALLANGRLEDKVDTLETQVKRSEEQVEILQRELAFVSEEKAEMEKLLRKKTAKETPDASKGAAT